jgi:hypothetical protein
MTRSIHRRERGFYEAVDEAGRLIRFRSSDEISLLVPELIEPKEEEP